MVIRKDVLKSQIQKGASRSALDINALQQSQERLNTLVVKTGSLIFL
jgi:hypothetical protein